MNSRNADQADAAPAEQRLELGQEVAVVAGQQHVGLAVAELDEGALDRDVDDLLGRRRPAGPAGSPSPAAPGRSAIGSSPLTARKNSPTAGWPHLVSANSQQPLPARPLLRCGAAAEHAAPSVASMFSPSTRT